MRPIVGGVTTEMLKFLDGDPKNVAGYDGYPVSTFRKLVEETAKLAYLNPDHLLFYRGQANDYKNKGLRSTFYPSIYRAEYLPKRELDNLFRILDGACKQLVTLFESDKIEGYKEVKRRRYIQWSILQHYEVCATPLLDFTHSLRVACSFAMQHTTNESAYIYVFGLPYLTNRISSNSEHELVNIRLLSICPPKALRPYFQEGYLVGTEDVTDTYDQKTELDFNNRLIAKFKIPATGKFWGDGFHQIPENSLYPKNDPIKKLCDLIKHEADRELMPGDIGDFMQRWTRLESLLNGSVRSKSDKRQTVMEATRKLMNEGEISEELYKQLESLRKVRNNVVHDPAEITREKVLDYIELIDKVIHQFDGSSKH